MHTKDEALAIISAMPKPRKRENRSRKILLSLTDRELDLLQSMADAREEPLAVTVRALALGAAATIRDYAAKLEAAPAVPQEPAKPEPKPRAVPPLNPFITSDQKPEPAKPEPKPEAESRQLRKLLKIPSLPKAFGDEVQPEPEPESTLQKFLKNPTPSLPKAFGDRPPLPTTAKGSVAEHWAHLVIKNLERIKGRAKGEALGTVAAWIRRELEGAPHPIIANGNGNTKPSAAATRAHDCAYLATCNLERIPKRDPNREKELRRVLDWIDANR